MAVRLKSTDLSFSGKQLTPVKKGQKRPIVSSSPSSSDENRPLKQSSSSQRITAKTVKVPAHPKFPSLPTSYTQSRGQIVSTKSKETSVPEAPGVQTIPFPQHSTLVVDLTATSSTSGNQGTEVPISIKPNSPTSVKNPVCPDLIPISSDDESLIPKSQEGTSTSLAASGLPTRDGPGIMSEPDGNISSSSNSSRASSRRKKQTTFYGSPIRHSVNIIHTQSISTPPSTTPASPDKKVRFVVANPELLNQAGPSRVVLPDDYEGLYRKFTRFPKKSSSDHPLRRSDK